ncbi:MAG: DUF5683 domain-containing protein [Bacteroidota bacterium]
MKHLSLYSLICLLLIFSVGSAQYISRYERPISTPIFFIPIPDTVIHLNEDSLIAAQIGIVDTTILPPKSPTLAMLSSMVIPGAGQIYNESYIKIPVIWGLGYYFYSVYKNQDDLYKQTRTQYERTLYSRDTSSNAGIKSDLAYLAEQYRGLRDNYKRQRNEFGWYLAITYILNIIDAYVDAALYNFEVSPNLQGTSQWQVRARIPLRK